MKTESKRPELDWDRRLEEVASSFWYPDTPDIHATVQKRLSAIGEQRRPVRSVQWTMEWRRLAQVALMALLALAALLAVPTVRAALAELLRVGAITIFLGETEGELSRSAEPAGRSIEGAGEDVTRTAVPTAFPTEKSTSTSEPDLVTVLTPLAVPDIILPTPTGYPTLTPTVTRPPMLHGPLTLPEVEEAADFVIRLPDSAIGLGPPSEIYLEHSNGIDSPGVVILVWHNPQGLEIPRLVLYQIGIPGYGIKAASRERLIESEVNAQRAYWIEGEHLLQIPDGNGDVETRLVGNVLIWTDGELTYRLEGAQSIVDAVHIAESLEPVVEN